MYPNKNVKNIRRLKKLTRKDECLHKKIKIKLGPREKKVVFYFSLVI